jgi:hypothetical protein
VLVLVLEPLLAGLPALGALPDGRCNWPPDSVGVELESESGRALTAALGGAPRGTVGAGVTFALALCGAGDESDGRRSVPASGIGLAGEAFELDEFALDTLEPEALEPDTFELPGAPSLPSVAPSPTVSALPSALAPSFAVALLSESPPLWPASLLLLPLSPVTPLSPLCPLSEADSLAATFAGVVVAATVWDAGAGATGTRSTIPARTRVGSAMPLRDASSLAVIP